MFPQVVQFRETASHARVLFLAKYVTARDFLSLLGRLVSTSDLVPLDRLRYQPLQLYLLAFWCPNQGQLMDRIPLDHPFFDPYEMVDQAGQCSSGKAHPGLDSPVGSVHGCLHLRLGRGRYVALS